MFLNVLLEIDKSSLFTVKNTDIGKLVIDVYGILFSSSLMRICCHHKLNYNLHSTAYANGLAFNILMRIP